MQHGVIDLLPFILPDDLDPSLYQCKPDLLSYLTLIDSNELEAIEPIEFNLSHGARHVTC